MDRIISTTRMGVGGDLELPKHERTTETNQPTPPPSKSMGAALAQPRRHDDITTNPEPYP
jgi:hypothetical protein